MRRRAGKKTILSFVIVFAAFFLCARVSASEISVPEEPVYSPPSRIIVTAYSAEGGGLTPGNSCAVTIELQNTSAISRVNSVLITGWIDSSAPVHFAETNQAYITTIPPNGTAYAEFIYYTEKIALSAVESVNAGFNIYYSDEVAGADRTNNVSVRIPVLYEKTDTEKEIRWQDPPAAGVEALLFSARMQPIYSAVTVFCLFGVVLSLLNKIRIALRRF